MQPLPNPDDEWSAYASELKRELWGDSPEELDPYYDKFSPVTGDVIDGWSMREWTLAVAGGVKFGTRDCTTVTRPRRTR
jgi:hypothetical protein